MFEIESISADKKAILLLCGHFGRTDQAMKPLTLSEYHGLTVRLRQDHLRPGDLLNADINEKVQTIHTKKVTSERLQALLGRGVEMGLALEQWSRQGIWILSRGDAEYPQRLKDWLKEAAPALIFGVGNPEILRSGGLGIVGSRDADSSALRFTNQLAARAAQENMTVVSGGAQGVDREAMQAAIHAGGRVLGILPEGISRPALARANREPLASGQLALIATCHPGARWSRGQAMGRNKYIYSLSDWTVAVSSGLKGGTWSGAVESLNKGWGTVMVRDSPDAPPGNAGLIQRGAIPLSPEDVFKAPALRNHLGDLADRSKVSYTLFEPTLFSSQVSEVREPPAAIYDSNSENSSNGPAESLGADRAPQIGDLFETVWPSLALAFENEVADKELQDLATSFHVQIGQLKAWINQAVSENLLIKRTQPVRYVLSDKDD